MRAKLTRLSSTHNNLRSDVIEGEAELLPEIGASFILMAAPLDEVITGTRVVWTTDVKSISRIDQTTIEFSTQNSSYRLEHEAA